MDGNVTIYKARLVAKGFRQVQGVDYDETFSPVAMLKSVRIMLAVAMFYEVWQMDVKTTFLKWIFKKKTDVDGNVTVHEARLVAKIFSQVQGVDYDEIFSSVAMLKSVGIMLALAEFMKSGRWMSK